MMTVSTRSAMAPPVLVAAAIVAAGLLCSWPGVDATCVLDADFGFILNCGFKKSGLFRVRNLGGVKGYVGLGFAVGDELRFNESLSNVEPTNRRRAIASARSSGAAPGTAASAPAPALALPSGANASAASAKAQKGKTTDRRRAQSIRQLSPTVPPFKPIAPAAPATASAAGVSRPSRLAPAPPADLAAPAHAAPGHAAPGHAAAPAAGVPPFVALPPSISRVAAAVTAPPPPPTHAPAPVAFRQALNAATHHFQVRKDVLSDPGVSANALFPDAAAAVPSAAAVLPTVPPTARVHTVTPAPAPAAPAAAAAPAPAAPVYQAQAADAVQLAAAIKRLAAAANVSAETLAAALLARRQQQLAALTSGAAAAAAGSGAEAGAPPTPASPPPPPPPPPSTTRSPLASLSKVMNAPREYYPVGYDKNFDDNFASRVELPDTSFYCGDQKHFPGLYADEDLGCMVFHVCALTDDGLIMKSFLCPESTLFDQTILKCNWWFYVDCKSSKKLYDSNIPISKSYQLMKALAFFSSYNKN